MSANPNRILRRLLRAMHTPGLSVRPTGIFVLAEAVRRGPIRVNDLNRACFGERRLVHSHLYPLEEAGYVTWERDRTAGLSGIVRVTAKGVELLGALASIAAETNA